MAGAATLTPPTPTQSAPGGPPSPSPLATETGSPPASTGRAWRAWFYQAYLQPSSFPAALLADFISWLVLVSLLAMIVEAAPGLDQYRGWLFAVELVVAVLFTLDYAANVALQPNRLGYVAGPWGIIDLLAIAPFFVEIVNMAGDMGGSAGLARTLLALRVLRVLRVLKLAKIADQAAEGQQSSVSAAQPSFWRDLLIGLIIACTILAVAEAAGIDHGNQLYWLTFGGGFALSVAARRWCVRHEISAMAVALLLGSMCVAVAVAVGLDAAGDGARANATILFAVAVIAISGAAVEGKEGAL